MTNDERDAIRTIADLIGATPEHSEPFAYSDVALRLTTEQRETLRQPFVALLRAGHIERGTLDPNIGMGANMPTYRFVTTDGAYGPVIGAYRLTATALAAAGCVGGNSE